MSGEIRIQQLEQLIRWMMPRLSKQVYVDAAKAELAKDPDEWKAERDEWAKDEAPMVQSENRP